MTGKITSGIILASLILLGIKYVHIGNHSIEVLASTTDNTATTTPLSLLTPNGGERWELGTLQNISWEGGDPAWPIYISLVDVPTFRAVHEIALGTINDGHLEWNVDYGPGEFLVYIEGCRGCPYSEWDYSDSPFAITIPVITVGPIVRDLP